MTFPYGIVSGVNLIPAFEVVGGAWTVSSPSFITAANGVIVPNYTGAARASYNLGYTGPFQLRWQYSALSTIITSVSIYLSIYPSVNFPVANSTPYSAGYDTRWVNDSHETNSLGVNDNTSRELTIYPKPTTSQTYQISRDENDVLRLHRDGTLIHTWNNTMSGAIAILAQANTNGTNVHNIISREYYNSDWNA